MFSSDGNDHAPSDATQNARLEALHHHAKHLCRVREVRAQMAGRQCLKMGSLVRDSPQAAILHFETR